MTTQTVQIDPTDDSTGEADESATFTLQNAANATVAGSPNNVFTLTIVDNDPIANDDSYTATGNVQLTILGGTTAPCAQPDDGRRHCRLLRSRCGRRRTRALTSSSLEDGKRVSSLDLRSAARDPGQ